MNFKKYMIMAAVGWYLLIPPTASTDNHDVVQSFTGWFHYGSYETVSDCQKDQQSSIDRQYKSGLEYPKLKDLIDDLNLKMMVAMCIASDDPRLAK